MEEILQKRLKEHEALVRVKATRYDSSPDISTPRSVSEWSRRASLDMKRNRYNMDDGDDYSFSEYSMYSDSPLKEKIQAQWANSQKKKSRLRPYILLGLLAVGTAIVSIYLLVVSIQSRQSIPQSTTQLMTSSNGRKSYFSELYASGDVHPGLFPPESTGGLTMDRCSICNCNAIPNNYDPSPDLQFSPRARKEDIYLEDGTVDMNEFMRQALLDIYCSRQHLDNPQAFKLARRTAKSLQEMMSWSLGSLELGKPTVYLTTATSPNGKAEAFRPQYIRRHGRQIRRWLKQQEEKAKADHPDWQVVWIIAEDEVEIDPQLVTTLRRTGVPFVYFAYGLTKTWGNAQKNAVMQVAYAMSRPREHGGILGHGPVYGLDDDNRMLPELLDMLTRLERVGVLPVGNLGAYGFESPIVDDSGYVIGSGSIWQPATRIFPFDFGGFAFNTSLLGTEISGPAFWKHTEFAGESEFLSQFVAQFGDLEPLCGRKVEQNCHAVWHNEPLLEMEKMSDEEEVRFIKEHGIEKYQQTLESQAREFDSERVSKYVRPDGKKPSEAFEAIPEVTEDGVEIVWVEVQA
ncbi:MAG: hypothetical protein LQ340_005025 [Diploschistes diacapsis]|nr:MAG: hypothetical protein LQ340_005025 [Diploschistes diacapsis]